MLTKGNPANAGHKLHPDKVQEWTDFSQEQMAIWKNFIDTDFITEYHFAPPFALKESV